MLLCPTGDCIVLHYPLQTDAEIDPSKVLQGDPATAEDDGELFYEENNSWCIGARDTPGTFNCCTFAVGDWLGLTPYDWIEPQASEAVIMSLPMQTVLDSYFRLVRTYNAPIDDWSAIAGDGLLQDDDVVCYALGKDPDSGIEHAGRIRKRNGQNWLLSKMGKGPIFLTTIRAAAAQFDDEFVGIRIYRANH